MSEVVVVGPASWNTLVRLPALPRPEPHTVFAQGYGDTVGGTSAGKALHLHDLGRDVLLHTVLGTDDAADRIRAALEGAGVPLRAAVVAGPSERHLNLMDPDGGRVSVYLDLPSPPTGPDASVVAAVADARAVVLDLAGLSLPFLPAAVGRSVWTDLHDYDGEAAFHRPFLAAAAHVFMNADGMPQPLDFMHATVDGGARVVVCTLGADGAMAVDADHVVHRVTATPVPEVVDTNGAGDAFLAGFLHATLDGAEVPGALEAAARQAARALGSRHLSPSLDS